MGYSQDGHEQNGSQDFSSRRIGEGFVFDTDSGIYRRTSKNETNQKVKKRKVPKFLRLPPRRKWLALVIPNIINLSTFLIVATYTYYAAQQVAVSQDANDAAHKAVRESGRQLDLTLQQLRAQVKATEGLTKKWDASVRQSSRLASAMEGSNEIARLQFESQASTNRAIIDVQSLELGQIGLKIIEFSFRLKNSGPTQAINIHYSVNGPYPAHWDRGSHQAEIASSIERNRAPVLAISGSVPDMLGSESSDPILVETSPINYEYLRMWDEGDFFMGKLTFEDMCQNSWERTFCMVVGMDNSTRRLKLSDCGVPKEGLRRLNAKVLSR